MNICSDIHCSSGQSVNEAAKHNVNQSEPDLHNIENGKDEEVQDYEKDKEAPHYSNEEEIQDYISINRPEETSINLYKRQVPDTKIPKRIVLFNKYWRKSDVINNPSWLFVFGDNIYRKGCKGQAIIRNFDNTVGIATKIDRCSYDECYFSDLNIKKNIKIIETDIEYMGFMFDVGKYDSLVFSSYGLGTGLARLEEKAPNTYLFLKLKLLEFIRDRELNITNILGQPADWEWLSI